MGPKSYLKVGVYCHPLDEALETGFKMEKEIKEIAKADDLTILGD